MKLCKYCKKELLLTKSTEKTKLYCGDKCNRLFNAKRVSLLRKLKYRNKKYAPLTAIRIKSKIKL